MNPAPVTKNEIFFLRTEVDRILFLSFIFSGMLVIGRTLHTGSLLFAFLPWNLFLAYIPYAISTWLLSNPQWTAKKWRTSTVLIGWLLFIPNSFYIMTDLFHLGNFNNAPLWYDLAMILSCAWNGLLLGLLSVRQVEKILVRTVGAFDEWKFIYPVMFLNALGIYIGRYLRFNSWDIITNPFNLTADIYHMVANPFLNVNGWAMIICFSMMLSLMYITAKRISGNVQ
jgi:uncharacterized membrane protein